MTTSRIISTRSLSANEVRNNAPAYSEVGQSLAGRARLVWETAHGARAVPDEPPAITPNPQGTVGIDMSGPPFGPCLLMPVALWTGKAESGVSRSTPLDAVGSDACSLPRWRVWHRAHATREDGSAPLQQLQLIWRGVCDAGAGIASIFEIIIVNRTRGTTTTINRLVNTTTATTYLETVLVPFAPGANDVSISFRRTTSTRVLQVRNITFAVAAKRRHGITFPG
jgi:hypothetical protein